MARDHRRATIGASPGTFFGLRGNAKICIALLPLWGIPYSFYYFYLSLYLREQGVVDAQLGLLMFALSAGSVLFSFITAPLVDRMGRRRSTLVFDLASSALPPLIFALSGRFVFALAGFLFMSANKTSSVGYYLLMSEDATDGERVTAFNLFNVIIVAAGVFIPAASGLVARYGIAATERAFLAISGVSMAVLALVRNRLVKETEVGRRVMERTRGERLSARAMAAPYAASLRYLARNPVAAAATAANVIFYVYYLIGTNNSLYFAPFFGDALGIGKAGAAALGSVYATGMLFAMLVVNPLARRLGVVRNSILGAAVNALGLAMLVAAPRGGFGWAVAAVASSSIGYGVLKSAIDAAIVVKTEGEVRSGIYSTANVLSSLLGIGAGALCAASYGGNPRSVYLLSFGLVAAIPLCFLAARVAARNAARHAPRGGEEDRAPPVSAPR
jgi:MFS family permease